MVKNRHVITTDIYIFEKIFLQKYLIFIFKTIFHNKENRVEIWSSIHNQWTIYTTTRSHMMD